MCLSVLMGLRYAYKLTNQVNISKSVQGLARSACLYFLQFREIQAETFFAVFALELDLNEFGAPFHFAFEDDAVAKYIVMDPIAGLILLVFGRDRRWGSWWRFGR